MEYQLAATRLATRNRQLQGAIAVIVFLLASNLLLSSLVWYALFHQKRLITPVVVKAPFTVSAANVDASYLRQMALFFIALRLNVTPQSVISQQHLFMEHIAPSFYPVLSKRLQEEATVIIKDKISSVFYPIKIMVYPRDLTVEVKGILKRAVGERYLPDQKSTYQVKFTYFDGDLKITSFTTLRDKANEKR